MDASQDHQQEIENMPNAIAKEEHFITEEDVVEDPNAVYIEDSPQKALEKLINLSTNDNFYERLQYINHLAELLEIIGEEGYIHLKIIISFIHEDKVDTKRDYLAQVTPILYQLQKRGEQGYKDIVKVMLPSICNLLHTVHYDVKEKSADQMAVIASILTQEDREKHLLPQILTFGHDHKNEENRMIGARMLNQMAPSFGKDICEHIIGAELLAMMEDIEFGVRKEAVYYLPSTAKVVSTRFFGQKLLPTYFRLCKDSNWEVRQACAQIIYAMSSLCVDDLVSIREKGLTDTMISFIKDSNQLVKIAAYKILGHFISTLQGLKVNEKLVDYYLRMTEKSINSLEPNDEIMYACAYSFPAVVLTLGLPKWKTLRKLFKILIKGDPKIKKPLACSLHEIAKVIGEEKTEKYLLPVLIAFLKDPNEGVKHGAIKNLASFFEVFSVEKRENMIDILVDLLKNQIEWRIRELIAQQIEKFTLLFSPEITFRIIAPLSFKLCNDPVAFVREEAVRKIHALFRAKYKSGEKHRQSIIENIKAFSQSNRFSTRQSFVLMCEKLMKDPEPFKMYFIDSFLPLGQDKVSNVRLTVAKALQKLFTEGNQLCSEPQIMTLVRKLKRDPCLDVRKLMQSITVPEDHSMVGRLPDLDQDSTLLEDSKLIEPKDKAKSVGSRLEKARMLAKLGKNKEAC